MLYTFKPRGVCSREIRIELEEADGRQVIQSMEAVGGCNGNLQGIGALLRGMTPEEAISRMKGIRCGMKGTSCPDQIAQGLERLLAEQGS
ncbi:MAG: TIGR03905 family TSCPD domain-containing protein [Clostridiales bacterium]|nr:TIGR03905 family TSCPD domain-containing protein [Clostridiales bacterium]